MTRLATLHKNPKHKEAENTDFILRMRFKKENDAPLKTDVINLSMQYVALYEALEQRLNVIISEKTLYLAMFNKEPWVGRAGQLRDDVSEMKSFLSRTEKRRLIDKDMQFPALQKMIDKIKQADPITLFAYLAVRCLGDVYGGQHLNEHTQKTFAKNKLKGAFYNGVSKQIKTLSTFVADAELTESEERQFFAAADDIFQLHIDLFKEMEQARAEPVKEDADSFNYRACGRYALFAVSTIGLATAAIGTAYCTMVSQSKCT